MVSTVILESTKKMSRKIVIAKKKYQSRKQTMTEVDV